MLHLAAWLREWAADKVTKDARFKHCTFIISDASEPGEGEHKVGWRVLCRDSNALWEAWGVQHTAKEHRLVVSGCAWVWFHLSAYLGCG